MAYGSATVLRTVRPGVGESRVGRPAPVYASAMSEQPTSIFSETGGNNRYPDFEPTDTKPTRRPLMWNPATDLGLLLLRLGIGGTFLAHGLQHVFGLWGGPGINGLAQFLGSLGFAQTITLAWVTGIGELVGGAFLVLGAVTPLAAAGLLGIMINAVLLKLGNGFFTAGPGGAPGFELELVLGLGAAALVLTGPGRIALDNGRAWHRRPASWGVLCLVIGVAAAVLIRILLHTDPPPPPTVGGLPG
jgi:putative oxidoreductase